MKLSPVRSNDPIFLTESHFLQTQRHGLQIRLHVADECCHEDEAQQRERDGEELLPLVVRRLQALPDGAEVLQPPPEAEEDLRRQVLCQQPSPRRP